MKTDKELAQIGVAAAKSAYKKVPLATNPAVSLVLTRALEDEDASTAFAKAVREAIFADCGEMPSLDKCIELYYQPGNHVSSMLRVQQACTFPLFKRIAELENPEQEQCTTCKKAFCPSLIEAGECIFCIADYFKSMLDRIRTLPEKWKQSTLSSSSMDKDDAIHDCANELLAALGEEVQQVYPLTDEQLEEQTVKEALENLIPSADPYAELKAAHKAGKVIEYRSKRISEWIVIPNPVWISSSETNGAEYRIKPWSLPPPPEGRQWHRDDWTEEMLPEGWRPLFYNEIPIIGDELLDHTGHWTDDLILSRDVPRKKSHFHTRTKRPLPPPPTFVPLEAKDIPPGSVFRHNEWNDGIWIQPVLVYSDGVVWLRKNLITDGVTMEVMVFRNMMHAFEISTDHGATWKPAKKLKEETK